MIRRYPALFQPRYPTRSSGLALLVILLLVAALAGCGGKDKDETEDQAQADRPHSLVPANLDSLTRIADFVAARLAAQPGTIDLAKLREAS